MATKKNESSKRHTPDFRDAQSVKAGEIMLTNDFSNSPTDISSYYLDRCIPLLDSLATMIREGQLTLSPYSTPKMRAICNVFKEKGGIKKLKKQELVDLYSSFSADILNIIAVIKTDKRYEKAWKLIVEKLEVTSKELKSILGRWPVLEISYGWYGDNVAPEALLFPLITVSFWREYNAVYDTWYAGDFTVDAIDRKTIADFLFGKDFCKPHLLKSLPEDVPLVIESFDSDIPTDIITLEGLALNGSLLTATGLIQATKIKKVRQQADIHGFRPDGKEWSIDRLELLCFAYFNMIEQHGAAKGETDAPTLARFAIQKIPSLLTGPVFGIFLPAYQGFTKSWTSDNHAAAMAEAIHALIRQAGEDWLSLCNFRMLLLTLPMGRTNLALRLFNGQGISKAQLVRKIDKQHESDRKWTVEEIRWFDEVGFSFAIHWIRFLCALGIVETALTSDIDPADPLEGLRYVRLTHLGRFMFGLEKNYTPPTAQNISGVDFDDRNCIITIDAKSPFLLFLSNVCKKISPTRFRISQETLLKGCKTKGELEQRISNLRVILDPERQPALKKIIDGALSHTDCAQREGGYSLLRLRPDLPGLREAILTDKELREMTILAGPTLALVKTHKMERFNAILASYGFLMD